MVFSCLFKWVSGFGASPGPVRHALLRRGTRRAITGRAFQLS
jgi:hypothetical protein